MRRGSTGKKRLLTTVLFTDIVGSTERAAEIGDARWRRMLTAHHRIVRRALKRHGGREIDTAGDGFFATFGQPSDAIACAEQMIDELKAIELGIRAGVHMGEVEVIGAKVGGIAVHVGARVMSQAAAGQVLVSSTVRELMSGSEVAFDDEGYHELKGVATQMHLFSVRRAATSLTRSTEPSGVGFEEDERRPPRRVGWVVSAAVIAAAVGLFVLTRDRSEAFTPAANTVVELDAANGEVAGGVAVGTTPTNLAFDGTTLWVANFDDKTVQRVIVADGTAEAAQGGVLSNPTGLAVGGGAVWVTNGFAGQLIRIDPGQVNAARQIPLVSNVQGVDYGEDAVWVASPDDGTVIRVDPVTNERRVARLPGAEPRDVAVGAGFVWATDAHGGQIIKIDPATMRTAGEIALLGDAIPSRVAFGEGYVWVTSTESDSVTRIDAASGTATTIDDVGNGPLGIGVGDGAVWVANSLDGTVARIDPATATVTERTTLGFSPDSVAVTPQGVWVSVHSL